MFVQKGIPEKKRRLRKKASIVPLSSKEMDELMPNRSPLASPDLWKAVEEASKS